MAKIVVVVAISSGPLDGEEKILNKARIYDFVKVGYYQLTRSRKVDKHAMLLVTN